jgi:hypothetical protein
VSDSSRIISRIRSCCEIAGFGAMEGLKNDTVDKSTIALVEKRGKLLAAAHEGEASFASDCNKEDCDRCDEDRQDAVTEKLKKCGS